jgi:hypothetical protein
MWYVIAAQLILIGYAFYLIHRNFEADKKRDRYKEYRDPVTGLLRNTKWKKE